MKHQDFLESLVNQVKRQPRGTATGKLLTEATFRPNKLTAADRRFARQAAGNLAGGPFDEFEDEEETTDREVPTSTPLDIEDEPTPDPTTFGGYVSGIGRMEKPQTPREGDMRLYVALNKVNKQIDALTKVRDGLKARLGVTS